MSIIVKYDNVVTPTNELLLDQNQALEAFGLFLQGKTPNQVRRIMFLPVNKLERLHLRFVEVREMIERIVKHEARLVREVGHYEEVDGEQVWIIDTPEELCPVPQTLAKLKERSLQLVMNDYDISEPLFATDDMTTLVNALNYVIEQIILHSNSTNDATFDWWKTQVIGG